MTQEQIERNRVFLADLRANEKKATRRMRDNEGGRCCMCVAFDTAEKLGATFVELGTDVLPPADMSEFYGWERNRMGNCNPALVLSGERHTAANLNDGWETPELTHAEIADAFEATFPELRP